MTISRASAQPAAALLATAAVFFYRGPGIAALLTTVLLAVFWVPVVLIRIRFYIFRSINDEGEALEIPCKGIRGKTFKWLYNHKAVNLRSKQSGYGLSDFFWYLLAPAHAIHQEHTESDDVRYLITSKLTRKICAAKPAQLEALGTKYAARLFDCGGKLAAFEAKRLWPGSDWGRGGSSDKRPDNGGEEQAIVRLRELVFPLFERIIFELVFGRELPDGLNETICASAENVIEAIKGGHMRDMTKRRALCCALEELLANDKQQQQNGEKEPAPLPVFDLDEDLCVKEWALFLQGVFFTTAVVQLSEGIAHIGVALAQKPDIVRELRGLLQTEANQKAAATKGIMADTAPGDETETSGPRQRRGGGEAATKSTAAKTKTKTKTKALNSEVLLKAIVTETMRLWPLFGDAHRITSTDITLPTLKGDRLGFSNGSVGRFIPKGTVVIFNYPKFHADGAAEAYGPSWEQFAPHRWISGGIKAERHQNYIPFGMAGNRPCPGKRISLILLSCVTREMVRRVDLFSPVIHTRSLPCGGLCIVTKRSDLTEAATAEAVGEGGNKSIKILPAVHAGSSAVVNMRPPALSRRLLLRVYVYTDTLSRSLWQLVYGAAMLAESKRLKLAATYFKTYDVSDPSVKQQAHKPCPTNQKDPHLRC